MLLRNLYHILPLLWVILDVEIILKCIMNNWRPNKYSYVISGKVEPK